MEREREGGGREDKEVAEIGEGTGREKIRGVQRQRNLHCAVCTKIWAL